jgi:O-antigen chain-terminating methyltransferase
LAEQQKHQLHALYSSNSWRITAPLRWPVHQLKLLREYGLKRRSTALLKKILHKLDHYLLVRPALRQKFIRLIQYFGLHAALKSLNDQLFKEDAPKVLYPEAIIDKSPSINSMTPQALRIYEKLKLAIERKKGEN